MQSLEQGRNTAATLAKCLGLIASERGCNLKERKTHLQAAVWVLTRQSGCHHCSWQTALTWAFVKAAPAAQSSKGHCLLDNKHTVDSAENQTIKKKIPVSLCSSVSTQSPDNRRHTPSFLPLEAQRSWPSPFFTRVPLVRLWPLLWRTEYVCQGKISGRETRAQLGLFTGDT